MKIIPYLRFAWAAFIVINFISQINFNFADSERIEIFIVAFGGLLTLVFLSYCIVIGLQEIREEQIFEARFFEIFGLVFEVLLFLGGLFVLTMLLKSSIPLWKLGLLLVWETGLILFIVTDFRRIRLG